MPGALPNYDPYGLSGGNPAGGSATNPLVANPSGGTAPAVIPGGGFDSNPATSNGASGLSGLFGGVPGTIGMPNPYADLSSVVPGLANDNSALSSNILSELSGGLSPGTIGALDQAQTAFGIPGTLNTSAASLGLTDTQLEGMGLGQWNSLLPTIAQTQTVSPALQTEIAQTNSVNAAAPNPTDAALAGIMAALAGKAVSVGAMGAL